MTQPPSGSSGFPSRPRATADNLPGLELRDNDFSEPRLNGAGNGAPANGPGGNGPVGNGPGGNGSAGPGLSSYGVTGSPFNRPPAPGAPAPGAATTTTGTGSRANAARAAANRARGPRRARLQMRHIDPWTVLKFSCVLAIALFFVWLMAVAVLFGVLEAAGVIGSINDTVVKINGSGSSSPITAVRVLLGAGVIGGLNIILFIALATIGSVVYNLCADLVGGIEVTLAESDA